MAVWKRFNGRRIKPSDKDWERGTWVVEFSLRGHYIKEAIPEARTRKQAEQVETNLRQAIFDNKYNRASGTTRVVDFIDDVFLKWSRESKRSWKDDEQRAKPLKEFFKGRSLHDITPMLIEKFKFERLKTPTKHDRTRSPATVNRELQVLSRVLSMAYENGIIDSNPMSRVRRLREPSARVRYLTTEEETALLNALSGYGEHPQALVTLALETGMRLGELLNLRWKNITADSDFMGGAIFVEVTKTDRPRAIPATERAMNLLRQLRQDAPDHEQVFSHTRTGRCRRQMIKVFERARKDAKLEDFRFHDLRHTFATRLRAAGVHQMDIMTLLGHRTLKVTLGYAHAVPERLRSAVDSLSNGQVLAFTPSARQVADN